MKTACITGINGQDGRYLAEFLLARGYRVHGLARKGADVSGIPAQVEILFTDYVDLRPVLRDIQPEEIYHLAGQSRVDESFHDEVATLDFNILGTGRLLAAIREVVPSARFYFAATSEMFGSATHSPQNEDTPFNPLSPYAVSKTAGFYLTRMYREAYGLYACSGILFNHESPRRPETFVVRKITAAAARIKLGLQEELRLGNLDIKRDWGFSGDHVEAMWLMLQQERPQDYVIGTGESHSVREILDIAFGAVELDWKNYVVSDPMFFRPLEAKALVADPTKARSEMGWQSKVSFRDMIEEMVAVDIKNQSVTKNHGLPR